MDAMSIKVGEYIRTAGLADVWNEVVAFNTHDLERNHVICVMLGGLTMIDLGRVPWEPTSKPLDTQMRRVRGLKQCPWITKNQYGGLDDYIKVLTDQGFLDTNRVIYKQNALELWLLRNCPEVGHNDTANMSVATALGFFRPFASTLTIGNISLTRTAKDKAADRQTSMKFGRALRYMFPHLSNEQTEKLVTQYRTENSPRVFTLKVGDTREDFRKAYTHTRADYFNPYTTCNRKSIASSCLHGTLTRGDISPAEVYASGDFSIAWLEDANGYIGGRVVIRDGDGDDRKPYAAPVYGVCETSLTQLNDYVDSLGATYDTDGWVGAKFLKLSDPHSDAIVGPYIDGDLCATHHVDDRYLELCEDGDGPIRFENTNGYVCDEFDNYCCECDEGVDDYDVMFNENGMCYCDDCFSTMYVQTDDGPVEIEDAVEVRVQGCSWRTREWTHVDNTVYCECVGEYWYYLDTTVSDDGDEYVPTHLIADYPELIKPEEEAA